MRHVLMPSRPTMPLPVGSLPTSAVPEMTARMKDGVDRNQPAYWDARFAEAGYAYGTAPNDFLVAVSAQLPLGTALCLCEGEGRNAVYLAERGFMVTAVDFSEVGLQKARQLAVERGVAIETVCSDLAGFDPGERCWDIITMIFGQPDTRVRRALYTRIAGALKPGGVFVLETKVEEGADAESRYPSAVVLRAELHGLDFSIACDVKRELTEGRYHKGEQLTAQLLGRKKK